MPAATAPGMGALTAAGGTLANGVPITAATGFTAAAAAQAAAINVAGSAGGLHPLSGHAIPTHLSQQLAVGAGAAPQHLASQLTVPNGQLSHGLGTSTPAGSVPRCRQQSQPGQKASLQSPQLPRSSQGGPIQSQSSPGSQSGSSKSPAPKKFRPSYTRPSNKSSRYVPKPMPQELANLKTYSK